ncbi:hypothetical protein [Streptomyces sp. NPDC002553]
MEIDTFWDVIEAAQAGAAATGEPFDEVLVKQLGETAAGDPGVCGTLR